MATLLNPFIRGMDANGDPVSGAKLAVFEAGTTTPVATYSDSGLTTPQAQPLIANSAGEFEQVFVANGVYKIRVSDDADVVLYENDNVRVADRPDDPIFFDTEADALASTDTYADGTLIKILIGDATFEAAPSGATDHDETNAGGQKLYRKNKVYDDPAALLASSETSRGEGTVWPTKNLYFYTEAASGASDHHVTNAGGVKFYVVFQGGVLPVPAFGAAGDGTTDDTAAINAAIAAGHAEGAVVQGQSGDEYRVTSSIWFGKDTPSQAKMLWRSNNSTIVGDMDNQPVVDLTGIQNGNRWVWDIRVTTAAGATPSHGILQARPKQASGVVSSGNANLFGAYVVGDFLGAAYYNVSSESNNLSGCYFQNGIGVAKMWSDDDYFKDTFEMPITSASASFSNGETITGGSSGATAVVLYTNSADSALFCRSTSGTFSNGETITGGTSGSTASASIPDGYTLCSAASPNAALGIEVGSTSTFQSAMNVFGNNTRSDDLLPCCIVRGFNDIVMTAPNFNVGSTTGDLLHLHKDVAGLSLVHPYLHAAHGNSVLLGDPAKTTGTQFITGFTLMPSYAGNPSGSRIKAANTTVRIQEMSATIFGELDVTGAPMQGQNDVTFKSRSGTGGAAKLTATITLEGTFRGDADTEWAISSSATTNRARIIGGTLSATARRESATISSGEIEISRNIVLVDTESSAATDDLETISVEDNMEYNGQVIYLRCLTASRVTTLVTSGGNIRGTSVDLDSTTKFVPLVYDAEGGLWYIL